ncbi:cytochrome P450 [Cryptosporangium phraense]|uniref:Cytochrome P450 n=1 Tax=Cryptosporangium phraense TaxID=2593070 RepID=A0A545AUT7_9ACTN|nr:cytochrome P450 [Cryptosporangium phraense]TQS45073.1 cytochrome P450 [Cryptosporangium phraense]
MSSDDVVYSEMNLATRPGEHFARYDTLRNAAPAHVGQTDDGEFILASSMEAIRACFQDPATFSSSAVLPDTPNPPYRWIPEMLDPPVHTKWRRLLAPFFAPSAVGRMRPRIHQVIGEILDDVADRGSCDYVADVALRFPNTIFLETMGLPIEDAGQFQVWETSILHQVDATGEAAMRAMTEVVAYFSGLIAERRKHPREDLLSAATTWTIDGEKVSDGDLLAFCLLMFMAGLDTVAAQLSYSTWHLATHPDDRRRLVDDPGLFPVAIEEFLRYYAFVAPGRKATKDTTVGGCPIKAGQMVWLPIASANRDPAAFPDAGRVVIDRSENRHLAFGDGPHRCIGAHLARQELLIGLTEWHRRIPDYRLDPSVPIREHGGEVGLDNLPLRWDVR